MYSHEESIGYGDFFIYLDAETLSDGSDVYSVNMLDCCRGESVRIPCTDREAAQAIFDAIESNIG